MATIPLPSDPGFNGCRATNRTSSRMAMSPSNYTQQVHVQPGKIKIVEFRLPAMTQAQAANWVAWAQAMEGYVNTSNFDITKAFPNQPSLTAVPMRLADPDVSWDVDVAKHVGLTFTVIEAK